MSKLPLRLGLRQPPPRPTISKPFTIPAQSSERDVISLNSVQRAHAQPSHPAPKHYSRQAEILRVPSRNPHASINSEYPIDLDAYAPPSRAFDCHVSASSDYPIDLRDYGATTPISSKPIRQRKPAPPSYKHNPPPPIDLKAANSSFPTNIKTIAIKPNELVSPNSFVEIEGRTGTARSEYSASSQPGSSRMHNIQLTPAYRSPQRYQSQPSTPTVVGILRDVGRRGSQWMNRPTSAPREPAVRIVEPVVPNRYVSFGEPPPSKRSSSWFDRPSFIELGGKSDRSPSRLWSQVVGQMAKDSLIAEKARPVQRNRLRCASVHRRRCQCWAFSQEGRCSRTAFSTTD